MFAELSLGLSFMSSICVACSGKFTIDVSGHPPLCRVCRAHQRIFSSFTSDSFPSAREGELLSLLLGVVGRLDDWSETAAEKAAHNRAAVNPPCATPKSGAKPSWEEPLRGAKASTRPAVDEVSYTYSESGESAEEKELPPLRRKQVSSYRPESRAPQDKGTGKGQVRSRAKNKGKKKREAQKRFRQKWEEKKSQEEGHWRRRRKARDRE